MTLVRFEPGSNSEPALDSSRHARSSGASPSPRRRAAYTSTGVRKVTEVSRFEQRCHHQHEQGAARIERPSVRRATREGVAPGLEEPVLVNHEAHEQQTRDEDEGGPDLRGRGACIGGRGDGRGQRRDGARAGEEPLRPRRAPDCRRNVRTLHRSSLPAAPMGETRVPSGWPRLRGPRAPATMNGQRVRIRSPGRALRRDPLGRAAGRRHGGVDRARPPPRAARRTRVRSGSRHRRRRAGLAKRGYAVFGIDVSAPMLTRGRQRLGPVVIHGDAMDLPIADRSIIRRFLGVGRPVRARPGAPLHRSGTRPAPRRPLRRVYHAAACGSGSDRPHRQRDGGRDRRGPARAAPTRRERRPGPRVVRPGRVPRGGAPVRAVLHLEPELELDAIERRAWPAMRELDDAAVAAQPRGPRSRRCGRCLPATPSGGGSPTSSCCGTTATSDGAPVSSAHGVQGLAGQRPGLLRGPRGGQLEGLLARPQGDVRARREGPMDALLAELSPEFGEHEALSPATATRFSSGKSPYKTAIAARIGEGYVQFSADGLFTGAGMYHMMPDQLARFATRRRRRRARPEPPKGHRHPDQSWSRRARHGGAQDGAQGLPEGPPADRVAAQEGPGCLAGMETGRLARHRRRQAARHRRPTRTKPLLRWLDATSGPPTRPEQGSEAIGQAARKQVIDSEPQAYPSITTSGRDPRRRPALRSTRAG